MRKLEIRSARVRAASHFHFEGSLLAGTFRGSCTGFDMKLELESDEDPGRLADAVAIAHHSCYTEDALARPVAIQYSHTLNGRELEVEV